MHFLPTGEPTLLKKAEALQPELIRLRRDFHRHPELSFKETHTAKIVAETLQEIGGINVKTGVSNLVYLRDQEST